MRYEFPKNITLDEVRAVIDRANVRLDGKIFIEADRGDHVIFNYLISVPGAFLEPNTGDAVADRDHAILRECRGLMFHKNGRILARKYAKFFNLGEKDETMPQVIDFGKPHHILEKLDGSMITPVYLGDDMDKITPEDLRWCTKMGITDVAAPVEEWVAKNQHYARYASHCMYAGYTLIFEWCSRQQKIVIDYPEDRLVLTAIRHNETGTYLPYEDLIKARTHGIEVVRALPGSVENLEVFLAETRALKGEEGYVIRFADGHMIKVKAEEYCLIHRTKDELRLDKDVIALILGDNVDDIKSFMDVGDRRRIDDFAAAFEHELSKTSDRLIDRAIVGYKESNGDKKTYAVEFMNKYDWAQHERPIMFKIFEFIHDRGEGDYRAEIVQLIRDIVKKIASTGPKVDSMRHLFGGISWERDFRDPTTVFDED